MIRMEHTIVITAAELVTSLGTNRREVWRRICDGDSGIAPLTALEQAPSDNRGGGQAPELPVDFCSDQPREVRYLRWTIEKLLREAGALESLPVPADRCGIVMGTTLHGMRAAGRFFREGSHELLRSFLAPPVLAAATSDRGICGAALTTCSACSSGLGAIGLGMTLLRSGELDYVICGGYDPISEYAYAGFGSLRLIASGPVRPFGRNREGMKLGEGYAALILEREVDAKRRGVPVLAKLLGYSESADAHHLTQPHPQGAGAARAMAAAVRSGGLTPDDVDLLCAHATGTPDNDRGEHAAMQQLFGDRLRQLPVAAFKSRLGHTLGGAGAIELILAMMALEHGIIPPTAGVTARDIEYDDLQLHEKATPAPLRVSLNTSIGFGGANASILIGRADVASPDAVHSQSGFALREVVITGVGVVLPTMVGNETFIAKLNRANDHVALEPLPTIEDAEIEHLVTARKMRRLSAYVKLSIAATAEACRDAALDPALHESVSVLLGSMHGSAGYSGDYYREIVEKGIDAANPMLFAEGVPNSAAAHVSMAFGFKGGCQAILGSRTSGLDALRLATLRITTGECERIVVSAGEEQAAIINDVYGRCGLMDRGEPSGHSLTFGCGAVTLILESRQAAEQRGITPRATIKATCNAVASLVNPREAIERGRGAWNRLGPADAVVTSAADSSLDRFENAIMQTATHKTCNMANLIGEAFSVLPLAGLAAALLSTTETSSKSIAVLATDYTGLITAARLECHAR